MDTAFGSTIHHIVSVSPKFLTRRYLGIIPPLKNIVSVKITMMKERNFKSFLESAYPADNVINVLINVPNIRYIIVFKYALHIWVYEKTLLYPSNVIALGKSSTLPAFT